MMEVKDLESFRNEWLHELEGATSECKVTSSEKVFAVSNEEIQSSRKEIIEERNVTPNVLKRNISQSSTIECEKYAAFNIANNYLNFQTDSCKYCNRQTKPNNASVFCSCNNEEKPTHSHKKKYRKLDKKYFKRHFDFSEYREIKNPVEGGDKNLVDLLIKDIDDITCIPFFDIELPSEIAIKVFQYLSIKDLLNCCLVNSKWQRLAQDDLVWFNLCDSLDVAKGVASVVDRKDWYQYVRETILEHRRIQRKWKERCCEVQDLGNDEELVLCAACIHGNSIVTSYLDGSIKLWYLNHGCIRENLREKYLNISDVVLSTCSCIHLNQHLCVAGFLDGNVMVWKCGDSSSPLVFMDNYDSQKVSFIQAHSDGYHFVVGFDDKFILVGASDETDQKWNWSRRYQRDIGEQIYSLILTDTVISPITIILSTRNQLLVYSHDQDGSVMLDQLTGATFSAIDYKKSFVVAGISGFGYSVLDGYRVRKYCLQTGKQVGNIIGSQTAITCMNYADCHDNQVVIGCADYSIRIHDFKDEVLLVKISGIESTITSIQMDKWKIVSGHQNGAVCLWDRSSGAMCWQSQSSKHPVHIAKFDNQLLTIVSIADDKFDMFHDQVCSSDESAGNKRREGILRVMDFTKDNVTIGVPDVCRAEYDDITGYDYNIELIAPYDDVQTLRLPKI